MKNFKRYFKRNIAPKAKRSVAFHLALILLFECGFPSLSLALTSGPSQPEVQSFEPIGTSEMVDVFSGDFNYNLPLIDVEGYPINLGYHSGITMDQEASWCGLGWNINPGTVNRSMRGVPDDFAGDVVQKEFNTKPNTTVGGSIGFSGELFGLDFASLNARLGIKYNNYTGVGIEKSLNVSLSASNKHSGQGSVSLGITSSSDDGLSLQPNINLSQTVAKSGNMSNSVGMSLGASYNSRGGLSKLTIGASLSSKTQYNNDGVKTSSGAELGGASASFDFGGSSYSPSLDMPMENLSVTGNFKLGGELFGFDGSVAVSGYYTSQGLSKHKLNSPAFGYMNSHLGQNLNNAMLDFNREKDGSFNPSTYNLPITNSTYDIYSVSGQGAGGSYRPFRSDVGHVFDAAGGSTSDGFEIGGEVGLGNLTHTGANITVNSVNSSSGDWNSSYASALLQNRGSANYPDYEPYYFKEANEKSVDPDQSFFDDFGGNMASRIQLDGSNKFNATTTGNLVLNNGTVKNIPVANYRKSRDRRSQTISVLSNEEVKSGFGLNDALNGLLHTGQYANIKHHIGQITSLGADGKRYVYGLPAYNTLQEETSFAVGVPEGGGNGRVGTADGLVTYIPGSDNSLNNKLGLDNYYNNITMPAFAHSYLLTGVISADYVDVDNVKGPSDGDIGTYVKFKYKEVTNNGTYTPFKWRTPLGSNKAKFNAGLYSDINDDKASYVYGEKQIFFLDSIITKNYIAKFYTSAREDALGVIDKNGAVNTNTSSTIKQQKLDKIELISKASNEVIKTVHFVYSYELAKAVPNNSGQTNAANPVNEGGKLTLKKVFFTYQKSDKGAFNAYKFNYAGVGTTPGINPSYSLTKTDRWGNFKRANPNSNLDMDAFPYTNQYSPIDTINKWSYAWHLCKIELPSGGEINVNYESDDYAYVQNEVATQMYPILTPATTPANFNTGILKVAVSNSITNVNDLLPDDNMLYFRFFMHLNNGKYDYVPGYAEINRAGCSVSAGIATIQLKPVPINDNGPSNYNPIIKAAIQFGRLNNSRLIWNQPNASSGFSEQVVMALINSNFFQNMQQMVQGSNAYLYGQGRGQSANLDKSWIKLKNAAGFKYGAGTRVKTIVLSDKFDIMVSGAEESAYGQTYEYKTKDAHGNTISSGVAPYEPQIGGEENALKHPFFTNSQKLLAPDDEHYTEAPFGENFFPSPGVGYSRVIVKNYIPVNQIPAGKDIKRHLTGFVEHEFYTAKDFPTITDRTGLEAIEHKNNPFSLASLFHIESKDYMTASQGFYVELNDMHGKPKSQKTYAEDQISPISSVEYRYKSTAYANNCRRLENKCTVIYPDGNLKEENIGMFFDAVGDLREQETESKSFGLNLNVDGFLILFVPVYVPVPIPSYSSDRTRFRSAVFTKVVQRFGILEETIANQDGSVVSTKNLAYDAQTGQTLLTQVNNNYEDAIYNFKYPAYWYYEGMASAYKNINYSLNNVIFNTSGFATIPVTQNKFTEGDELEMRMGNTNLLGWVTKATPTGIEVQYKSGTIASGLFDVIKVIRSGARNLTTVDMANITTMVNPLDGVKNNIYDKVIQAASIEYGNRWRTRCDCPELTTGNPYANGIKGTWRPLRNYVHLTGRTQSDYNNNTNIRKDGMFTTYTPFYKLNPNGKWTMNPQNWTYASEITEFNPYGQELENVDALGRYSAATFGFNQTMATAVGANGQYKELGFDSFEDYGLISCADKHFKFGNNSTVVDNQTAHTGKHSIKVLSGSSISMEKQIAEQCEKFRVCAGRLDSIANTHTYEVINGNAPYNIEVNNLSGSGNVEPIANGFRAVGSPGLPYKVQVTVTDDAGCVYVKLVTIP